MRGISYWNNKVEELIKQHGVKYFKEVSCKGLRGSGGGLLRFDFMLINHGGYGLLIEIDETQNHKNNKHDEEKNDYCIKRKYPLLRIKVNNNDKGNYDKEKEFKKTVEQVIIEFSDKGIVKLNNELIFTNVIDVTKLDKPTGLGHFALVNNDQYYYNFRGEFINRTECGYHLDLYDSQQFLLGHQHNKQGTIYSRG